MLPPLTLDFWAILLLFGALQGFFFAGALFLHRKGKRVSTRLLTFLLVIFSLHLIEYVIIASGFYQSIPHVIGLTLPVVFLIGPIYYLYAASLLTDEFHFARKHILHFMPAVLCYLLLLPFYTQSPHAKAAFIFEIMANGYVIFPFGQFLLMALSSCQMLVYFYLTFALLNDYEENFKRESSSTEILNIDWLRKISLWFSIYMLLFFVAYFQLFFLKAHRQEIFFGVMLILSIFIHAVGYNAIRQPEIFSRPRLKPQKNKYEKSALSKKQSETYLKKIIKIMRSERPYLDPELKLPDLAESVQILPNHLSQVINAELNKNFFRLR